LPRKWNRGLGGASIREAGVRQGPGLRGVTMEDSVFATIVAAAVTMCFGLILAFLG